MFGYLQVAVGQWFAFDDGGIYRAGSSKIRPVTNFVQGWPKTTNADRAETGITVRHTSPSPAPAPSSRPLALVESG